MENIIKRFQSISDWLRVVLLIHRSKEWGANNKFKRHIKKIITTNSEEFFEAIRELKEIKDRDKRPLRIYASCNSRDINKAIRLFKEQQLANDYDPTEKHESFYIDIKNRFISCLMDKSCRAEKNFIIDLDWIDDRSFVQLLNIIEKRTEIILSYRTKNGFHIITEPFNYIEELDDDIIQCVHTDGQMLIDY